MNKRFLKLSKLYYVTFGVATASVLALLTVGNLVAADKDYSASEKRNLKSFPELSIARIADGSFMDGIEDYIADQFVGRNMWMGIKTTTDRAVGIDYSQGVYACENDYLIQRFEEPDEELMNRTIRAINSFADKYTDAASVMLMVPNVVSVYNELLPGNAITADQNEYMDKFYSGLSDRIKGIDVRKVFEQQKDDIQLYYYTDHHWTTDAAELAYHEYAGAIGVPAAKYKLSAVCSDFKGSLAAKSGFVTGAKDIIKVAIPDKDQSYVVTYEEEKKKTATCYDVSMLKDDDPYQLFFGGNHAAITIDTSVGTGRRLLVFKDSYANCFIPMLLEHYERISVIDPRYYYGDIDSLMLQNKYTDVLYLYNINTFAEDNNLYAVLENE